MTNAPGIIELNIMEAKTDVRPSLRETIHEATGSLEIAKRHILKHSLTIEFLCSWSMDDGFEQKISNAVACINFQVMRVRSGIRIFVGVKFNKSQEKQANTGEGAEAHEVRDKRKRCRPDLWQQFLSSVYKNDIYEQTMTNAPGFIEFEVMGAQTDVRSTLRETVHEATENMEIAKRQILKHSFPIEFLCSWSMNDSNAQTIANAVARINFQVMRVRTGVRISVGVKFSQGQGKQANTGEDAEAHDQRRKRIYRKPDL